jgi:hypothetical protein
MTKKYLFNLLVLVGLVIISGIIPVFAQDTTTRPKADVPGTYTRKEGKTTESLALTADQKVVWTSMTEGKENVVLSGTWETIAETLTITIPSTSDPSQSNVMTFKLLGDGLEVISTAPNGVLPAGTKYKKDPARSPLKI